MSRTNHPLAVTRVLARGLLVAAALLVGGCDDEPASACRFSGECASGMVCAAGACVPASVDAATVVSDAGSSDAALMPTALSPVALAASLTVGEQSMIMPAVWSQPVTDRTWRVRRNGVDTGILRTIALYTPATEDDGQPMTVDEEASWAGGSVISRSAVVVVGAATGP